MIGLLQRVSEARVSVLGRPVGAIDEGLLVMIGVERADSEARASRLLDRLLGYRVFADPEGRMNISLAKMGGGLLLIPQFTLAANTQKGTRPGFSQAESPKRGEQLFTYLCEQAEQRHPRVARGIFGAHMQVHLINDGPVTFWLQV
ncbi:MAG: D-tyrosyl-tRNA(Tyr) deacylase [Gammaproteobacteria bacterium]|nr:D-tyrosyl-tRNA(Tyr) deacylase [Gammaproteobacteria bacterium]